MIDKRCYFAPNKITTKPKTIKPFINLLIIFLLYGCSSPEQSVFQTTEKYLSIRVDGKLITNEWEIDPELNPDIYEVECQKGGTLVTFADSKDSISFNVAVGDQKDFNVLTTSADSALTRIIGIKPNYNFTDDYIKQHQGKTNVEIPEVSELANILVALHRDMESDKNMTDSDSDYYQKVKAHFQPHADHPMMDTIHKYIKDLQYIRDSTETIFSNDSYYYYYALKMNACAYEFMENGEIFNKGFIDEMAKGWSPFDPFKDKALMEDFAQKSDFRTFYQENKSYYDELLKTYDTLNPIGKMQQWLDKKFGFSYGNYTIYFSPLVSGAHSTKGFDTESFKQTFMFIAKAEFNEDHTRTMNELLESRVVFTEIDHNYVDLVSAKYTAEINSMFSNRTDWAKEELTSSYPNPTKVFNEYMTFAVYSLYALDTYDEAVLMEFLPRMENQMENGRGFIKFKSFNRTLLKYYQENPDLPMESYFEFMLANDQGLVFSD